MPYLYNIFKFYFKNEISFRLQHIKFCQKHTLVKGYIVTQNFWLVICWFEGRNPHIVEFISLCVILIACQRKKTSFLKKNQHELCLCLFPSTSCKDIGPRYTLLVISFTNKRLMYASEKLM